jgi:hypothetical protein
LLATVAFAADGDTNIGADGRKLEGRILESATRLATRARDLDLDGLLLFTASLEGVEGLVTFAPRDSSRPLGRPAIHLGEVVVADASAMGPLALQDLFDQLWLKAGFDRTSPSFAGDIWQGDVAPSLHSLDWTSPVSLEAAAKERPRPLRIEIRRSGASCVGRALMAGAD